MTIITAHVLFCVKRHCTDPACGVITIIWALFLRAFWRNKQKLAKVQSRRYQFVLIPHHRPSRRSASPPLWSIKIPALLMAMSADNPLFLFLHFWPEVASTRSFGCSLADNSSVFSPEYQYSSPVLHTTLAQGEAQAPITTGNKYSFLEVTHHRQTPRPSTLVPSLSLENRATWSAME